MLIEDVLGRSPAIGAPEIDLIKEECSQFLTESDGLPLFRLLPSSYTNLQKVKVRLQKRTDQVTDVFNRAFGQTFNNLRQRAIFASPAQPMYTESSEPFFIFPTNGYRFLYSKEVSNSNSDYKSIIDTLFEQLDDFNTVTDLVTDVVKYTYTAQQLCEGIASGSEIIVYGIPYYYAVRMSSISYDKLIKG